MPLQAIALEALDRLPLSEHPVLFVNSRGGRIDFRSFGRRHWKPAQIGAGIEPLRHLYDLRHTYATFALRAGTTANLARDSREHAVSLLDALALERAVDAEWTSHRDRAKPVTNRNPRHRSKRPGRVVEARWTPRLVVVAPLDNERS